MKFEFQSDFCNFVENSVDMGKDKITTDSRFRQTGRSNRSGHYFRQPLYGHTCLLCQMVLQSFGQGVLCMDESVQ